MPSTVTRGTVAKAICLLAGHTWQTDWSQAFTRGKVRVVCQRCHKQQERTLGNWKRRKQP